MKNVQSVLLGKYEVEAWYFSPYPDDYSKLDKVGRGSIEGEGGGVWMVVVSHWTTGGR